jgi:subtilisin family serine protease
MALAQEEKPSAIFAPRRRPARSKLVGVGGVVVWLCFAGGLCAAQSASPAPSSVGEANYRDDRILIQPKSAVSPAALAAFHSSLGAKVLGTFDGMGRLQIIAVPKGETAKGLIGKYQRSGLMAFAEPDYFGHTMVTTPNDPRYLDGTLWALNNSGQSGGTPDADIDAPEAWDALTSASNIVVAVLDTGVLYTHEDLAANMWVNPSDGGHGFNALTGTNDPNDVYGGHGTRVAGILGAVGNNGKGVTGVAWQVQIMACKCFNNFGVGSVSDVITCFEYARTNGAKVINASFGFADSLALFNAVAAARDAGIIVVAACGNGTNNIDVNPTYPASYHLDNVVSVAYTTRNDTLAAQSNYGATNVHLAAPGDQIYSTFAATDNYYNTDSGTSFAAPYVAGAFALMLAKFTGETHQQIISRLLNATDPLPSLAGKCATGGRLNLRNALSPPITLTVLPVAEGAPFRLRVSAGPRRLCVVQTSATLTNWSSVFTNTTSDAGTFDFADGQSVGSAPRFYRAVSTR